jgi:hypothetical protein
MRRESRVMTVRGNDRLEGRVKTRGECDIFPTAAGAYAAGCATRSLANARFSI